MVRIPICCTLVLLASSVPRAGRAEEDRRAQAGADYARGITLAEQGLYAAALEQFRSAYEKSPHFAVLYNIGQADMALGKPIEAIEALTRYLRDGADQVPLSRREQVQAQIALLEGRLAELSVTTDRSGALVTVDGREVGRTPLYQPIRLAAGTHTVSIAMEGIAPIIKAIDLREGDRQVLAFVVPAGIAPKPPATALSAASVVAPPPAPPPRDLRKWAYVSAGVGAAAGAAALGIYLWNRGRYDDWQATNTSLQALTPGSAAYHEAAAANNARSDSLTTANHAIVGLSIASGVLIAGGAALYLVDRTQRREHAASAARADADGAGWSFDVAVGPNGSPRLAWSATW